MIRFRVVFGVVFLAAGKRELGFVEQKNIFKIFWNKGTYILNWEKSRAGVQQCGGERRWHGLGMQRFLMGEKLAKTFKSTSGRGAAHFSAVRENDVFGLLDRQC
jgi:hypothetical protein